MNENLFKYTPQSVCILSTARAKSNNECILSQNLNMRFLLVLSLLLSLSTKTYTQSLSPEEIIGRSIEYHDPDGKLQKKNVDLFLTETRPNGSDRKSEIGFNIKKEKFKLNQLRDDNKIVSMYDSGKVSFLFNGGEEYSKEIEEKYKLNKDRVQMLRSYYQYLWLMPLKLKDEGTNFNPLVKTVDFFGKESLEIRVTYDPSVGSDVWYFYFNPESFALQGYRFYHDEEKNDGEYIILEEEVTHQNVRIPKERKWYTHKEDKFLGADILDKFTF